tara:strand:- start:2163 stop:2729 length:567 start_codon:yes stop_codon:yes gene_type:complete
MRKSIHIILKGKFIDVEFYKELKNHSIIITFEIVNPYQMKCISLKVASMGDYEITSTNIRNINIHTLIKRSLKAIYSYKTIDTKEFNTKTKGYLSDDIRYKLLVKDVKERKIKDRNKFLSIYSYIYQFESRNYGDNVSKRLSRLLNYSESYIKNLTKEAFSKNYINKNTKGVSGGLLTNKSITTLNSL